MCIYISLSSYDHIPYDIGQDIRTKSSQSIQAADQFYYLIQLGIKVT